MTERPTRRRVLRAGAIAGTAGLAGCVDRFLGEETPAGEVSLGDFRGSGPFVESRPELEGTRIGDLPALEGELTVYVGGGEGGLYDDLLGLLEQIYPDFTAQTRQEPSAQLANTIIEETEGGSSPADVFWAVDAGALGAVAAADATMQLPEEITGSVPTHFHPDRRWVGVAGRARAVPYNTDELSADDVPDTVMDFPGTDPLAGSMGWAPTYGAFQSFVTAMRLVEGEDATRQWLSDMQEGSREFPDEFLVSNAVADGSIAAGFANHYYALRVKAQRSDAPIDLAFTSADAGALVNASGVGIVSDTDEQDLAETFVHHLLTVEAQEFFATRTFAYPMLPGVPPVGDLPTIDELNPPDVSLQDLSDVEPTLELMREVGVL